MLRSFALWTIGKGGANVALLGTLALAAAACGDKRDAGIGDSIHVAGGALDVPPDTSALRATPGMLPPAGATPAVAPPPAAYYPSPQYSPGAGYGSREAKTNYEPPPPQPPLPSPALERYQPPPPSYANPAPLSGQSSASRTDSASARRPGQPPSNTDVQRIAIPAESLRAAPRNAPPAAPQARPEPAQPQPQAEPTTPIPPPAQKPVAEPPRDLKPEALTGLEPDTSPAGVQP